MKTRICLLFIALLGLAAPLQARVWRTAPQDTIPVVTPDTTAAAPDSTALLPPPEDSLSRIYRLLAEEMGCWEVDSLTVFQIDSCFAAYYDSLALSLPDSSDIRKLIRRQRREYRDSVRIATPRILSTFALPDSLWWKRTVKWTSEHKFNEIEVQEIDTLYNGQFFDYPFFKKDVNATYLGTVGSAAQPYNWFKHETTGLMDAMDPYLVYSYTPDNLPQYNTKNPYTELAYWGTFFALKAREEMELHVLTTQNITPALNFSILYEKWGSKGMLQNEATDNRTLAFGLNHLGKKYLMNAGFIHQRVERTENGGIQDIKWIRDTIVDAKEIAVNLSKAANKLSRNTLFITQSYAIPMNFFRKDKDSLAVGEGTMAFIGHSGEVTLNRKVYTDAITSTAEKDFYDNNFFLHPSQSADSLAMNRIENKAFLKLQPYAPDALLAKVNAGVGYRLLSYYSFDPQQYISGAKSNWYHNAYLYAGAEGSFRKYIAWDADGQYSFAGYNFGDFALGGRARLSVYPFKEGIHLIGTIRTTLSEPNPLQQTLHFNHHDWSNDFGKISDTRAGAQVSIPAWKLKAGVDYALVANMIYYDSLSVVRQADRPVSILAVSADHKLKLGPVHWDNRALFQLSSNDTVAPLPRFALNSRLFFEFTVVKDAMDMQIGVNGLFTTGFYVQGYSPDLGVFYNQRRDPLATHAYFDAFVNMQWQVVCLFVKYTDCFRGWPNSDAFAAFHYIRPEHGFKFGVFWPF